MFRILGFTLSLFSKILRMLNCFTSQRQVIQTVLILPWSVYYYIINNYPLKWR